MTKWLEDSVCSIFYKFLKVKVNVHIPMFCNRINETSNFKLSRNWSGCSDMMWKLECLSSCIRLVYHSWRDSSCFHLWHPKCCSGVQASGRTEAHLEVQNAQPSAKVPAALLPSQSLFQKHHTHYSQACHPAIIAASSKLEFWSSGSKSFKPSLLVRVTEEC